MQSAIVEFPCSLNKSYAVATSAGSATPINKIGFRVGMIHFVSGSVATLTFYAAPPASPGNPSAGPGDFTQVYEDDGTTALDRTIASGKCVRLPLELAGAAYIKIVGDAAGVIDITLS